MDSVIPNDIGDSPSRFKRFKKFLVPGLLALALPLIISQVFVPQDKRQHASEAAVVRGAANDFWADVQIGRRDFTEIGPREIVPFKLHEPGGVIVDTSVSPGRMYVWDSGNNRILGIDLAKCYGSSGPCTADVVLGQPSGSDHGACNLDSSFQYYPNRAKASSTTLCGVWEGTHTVLEDKSFSNMAVNATDLFVPDMRNHRILKYSSPFTTDAIADEVWGQDSFEGNECNKTGSTLNNNNSSPTASSLCLMASGGPIGGAVAFDQSGNMWVADGGNSRILRYVKDSSSGLISKTADLVLGQSSFTTRVPGSGPSQFNGSTALVFDLQGNLYVADTANNRIVKYAPPFASGMTGVSLITITSPADIKLNATKDRFLVLTQDGSIKTYELGGALAVGSLSLGQPAGGSIGQDANGNMLISTYAYGQDVSRVSTSVMPSRDSCAQNDGNVTRCDAARCAYYFCSNRCWQKGTSLDVGCSSATPGSEIYKIDKNLFQPPGSYNLTSARRLEAPGWPGMAVAGSQLIVTDNRFLFWNNVQGLTNGQSPDGYIGSTSLTTLPTDRYNQVKTTTDRVWASKANKIEVYQTPLATGMSPVKTIGPTLPALGGGSINLIDVSGLAPTDDGKYLWLSEGGNHRVLRVRDPLTNPVVDIILGQKAVANNQRPDNGFTPSFNFSDPAFPNKCNQGLVLPPNTNPGRVAASDAKLDMLCFPGSISLDKKGNLYVSDHIIESAGNWRLLMYSADLATQLPASIIFAPPASKEFPRKSSGNTQTHATFGVAFDSQNRMVTGYNPYFGNRFLEYYNDPTKVGAAGPSDPLAALPDGKFNDFYSWPIVMAFDSGDNLYAYDANRGQVRIYKHPFALPTNTPTSSPLPSSTPTPTPVKILTPTPTKKPTPVPTRLPSSTPTPTLVKKADLTITSFALTDSSGTEKTSFKVNEAIYVKMTYKNTGTTATVTTNGTIYSTAYKNMSSKVSLNRASDPANFYSATKNLAAGESKTLASYPRSSTRSLFPGIQTWKMGSVGSYVARIFVDYDGRVVEASESNNQLTRKYTIVR